MSQKDIRIVQSRLRPMGTPNKTIEQVRAACNVNTGPKPIKQLPVAPGAGNGILPGAIWIEKATGAEIMVMDLTPTGIVHIAKLETLVKDEPTPVVAITQKGLQDKYVVK